MALRGLGPHAGEGSDLLCVAIAGGAIVPFLQGLLAHAAGLHPDPVLRHPLRATRSGRVAFPAWPRPSVSIARRGAREIRQGFRVRRSHEKHQGLSLHRRRAAGGRQPALDPVDENARAKCVQPGPRLALSAAVVAQLRCGHGTSVDVPPPARIAIIGAAHKPDVRGRGRLRTCRGVPPAGVQANPAAGQHFG